MVIGEYWGFPYETAETEKHHQLTTKKTPTPPMCWQSLVNKNLHRLLLQLDGWNMRHSLPAQCIEEIQSLPNKPRETT